MYFCRYFYQYPSRSAAQWSKIITREIHFVYHGSQEKLSTHTKFKLIRLKGFR